MTNETYLGDGLFASFADWQIRLRAPREESVLRAFLKFLRYIWLHVGSYNSACNDCARDIRTLKDKSDVSA